MTPSRPHWLLGRSLSLLDACPDHQTERDPCQLLGVSCVGASYPLRLNMRRSVPGLDDEKGSHSRFAQERHKSALLKNGRTSRRTAEFAGSGRALLG
jgi:hypothetical protein